MSRARFPSWGSWGSWVLCFAALVAVLGAPSPSRADGFDGQRFVPAAGAAGGFVVERPLVPRHLGFGLGKHFCPGYEMARAEAVIGSELLLEACPEIRMAPGFTPQYRLVGPTWNLRKCSC